MIKRIIGKLLLITILVLGFVSFVPSPAYAAATLYLSPSSKSITKGETFTLAVRVNISGNYANAVEANLSYPTSKLQYVSIDASSSAFEVSAEARGGGGVVRMARASTSLKSGDKLVYKVKFKALATGKASVTFRSDSFVVKPPPPPSKEKINILSGKTGGTYTITSSGGGVSTGGSSGGTTTTKTDKTAPKITEIKVTNLTRTSATITWKTNEAANSIVDWGPNEKLGLVTSNSKLVKSHSIKLQSKLLTPGANYKFKVTSKDKAGNKATSDVRAFIIPGYTVQITVTDGQGAPVVGVVVKLVSVGEVSTDENGVATFKDVPAGKQVLIIEVDGEVLTKIIEVKDTDKPQKFDAQVKSIFTKASPFAGKNKIQLFGALLVIIGLFIIVLVVFFRNKLLRKAEATG